MKNRDIACRKCNKCDRVFSKVEHLRRHQRSHTGERPFKCSSCGRTYARSDVLTRHVRNNHCPSDGVNAGVNPGQPPGVGDGSAHNPPLSIHSEQETRMECTTEDPWPTATGNNILHASPDGLPLENPQTEWSDSLMTSLDQASLEAYRSNEAARDWDKSGQASQPPQYLPNSHQTVSSLYEPLDPSIQSSTLHDGLDLLSHGINLDDFTLEGLLMTPPSSGEPPLVINGKYSISNEQFEQVRKLWPTRRRKASVSPSRFCCDEVVLHSEDGIFSSSLLRTARGMGSPDRVDSMWGFTSQCRGYLVQKMHLYKLSHTPLSRDIAAESPASRCSWAGDLPPTDILDLSLDLYFSQVQVLFPFIHPPCFNACDTPSVLLFPMCLTGYMILDRKAAFKLIHSYLPGAIHQCRAEIASQYLRTCPASDLFIVLAGAVLLLFIAACTSDFAFEEQRQRLYEETLLLARERGLFGNRQYNLSFIQGLGDDAFWKAWARVQSAERLIATLIITDSYSAQILGVSPILQPDKIEIPLLCSDSLFFLYSLHKWKACVGSNINLTQLKSTSYDINNPPEGLSGFGLQIFLSCAWLHILTSRHHILAPAGCEASNLTLIQLFSEDSKSQSLGPGLIQVFKTYGSELVNGNANSILLWHLLSIHMTTNLPTIEDAAGRSGPEAAKAAVESLRIWADSTTARRAFIHATQTYILITRHRKCDGVMLHSEMAFFTAALVMGFYLFTAPGFEASNRLPFDVLEELNWEEIGSEGMDPGSSLPVAPSLPAPPALSAPSTLAVEFIRHGGPVSFQNAEFPSYGAARRSFMNFAAQLEEVGKWNTREYCRVLRILSDTLPGCFDSGPL